MRTAIILLALTLGLTACDNPFRDDGSAAAPAAAAPGESTPAEDAVAISNYLANIQTPEINIRAGGDVFIATDGGSIVYRPVPPTPDLSAVEPAEAEPTEEPPVAP